MVKKESGWNKVAVVLVNYNGKDIIEDCISSLYQQNFSDMEIVVVDNGSKDGSMALVEEKFPQVHTLYMNENAGWGAGSNRGMNEAFLRGAEYGLLLNTDTECEPGMLEELLMYCDSANVAVPRMYRDKENKEHSLWYSGGAINFETADVCQTLYEYHPEQEDCNQVRTVEFATGCCILVNKEVWEKSGGFDEEYFLYYEDVDYCMKLKESGVNILYVPKASLWHKVGGSAGGETSYVSQYYTVRNRLFFAERYQGYMKNGVMGALKEIMRIRTYFTSTYDKRYQRVVINAIEDYMKGIRGKERNLFHEGYTILKGFYELEELSGMFWQWNGERVAEIELKNPHDLTQKITFRCELIFYDAVQERKIDIYWNNELVEHFAAPQVEFSVSRKMEAGEKAVLRFLTEDIPVENEHLRALAYMIRSVSVSYEQAE